MTGTETVRRDWWLSSPTACVFAAMLAVVMVRAGGYMLNLDGDLARHLAHGRYMFESGHIMRDYPFAFSTPGRVFLPMEYGSQLLFTALFKLGGLTAIATVTTVFIAASHMLQMRTMVRRGVDPVLGALTVTIAAAMGSLYWQARPHIISLLIIALLLSVLESKLPKRPWWALILFAVWANFHPAWVYGLILIGIYGFGALCESFIGNDKAAQRERLWALVWVGGAAFIGTFLTPNGIELHKHVLGFLGQTFEFNNVAEFFSPDFHKPVFRALLAGILLVVMTLGLSQRRLKVHHLVILITHVQQALKSHRYAAMLGITGMTVLAIHLAPEWDMLVARFSPLVSRWGARWRGAKSPLAWAGAAALIIGLAVTHGRVLGRQVVVTTFSETRFPMRITERAMHAGRTGHLYAENISWSSYIIFAWPGQQIFRDGSGDFFGDELLQISHKIRDAGVGYDTLLTKWNIELVMASARSPLTMALAKRTDWKILDCDAVAVLLGKSGIPEAQSALGKPIAQCVNLGAVPAPDTP